MLTVEPTDQHGPATIGSGRNGLDLEKFRSSISPLRRQIELWLLLNATRKSWSVYHFQ